MNTRKLLDNIPHIHLVLFRLSGSGSRLGFDPTGTMWHAGRVLRTVVTLVSLLVMCEVTAKAANTKDLDSLIAVADSMADREQDDSAIALGQRVVGLAERRFGPNDSLVACYCIKLGTYYYKDPTSFPQRKADSAACESNLMRGLDIRQRVFGRRSLEAAASLLELGRFENLARQHGPSESYYRQALKIRQELLGENSPEVAEAYFYLALVCGNQNKIRQAQEFYGKCVQIRLQVLKPDDPALASSIAWLATTLQRQGELDTALVLFKKALGIYLKRYGPRHRMVAKMMNNIGSISYDQGDYPAAESWCTKALALKESILTPDHPDLCTTLEFLGDLYTDLGRFEDAERTYKRVIRIFQQTYGPEHINTAVAWEGLGKLYLAQGRRSEADTTLRRALQFCEKMEGSNHPDAITILILLARLSSQSGNFAEAQRLLGRASRITDSIWGSDHPLKADILDAQGVAYMARGESTRAETMLQLALQIRRRVFGPSHTSNAASMEHLGELRRTEHRLPEALEYVSNACRLRLDDLYNNASAMAERDALGFSRSMKVSLDLLLSVFSDLPHKPARMSESVADLVLRGKGQVTDCIFEQHRRNVLSTDRKVQALSDSIRTVRCRLSSVYVEGPKSDVVAYRSRIDSLQGTVTRLESDLSLESADFRHARDYNRVTCQSLKRGLPPGSVLIEFLRFNYHDTSTAAAMPRYLAVVLRRNQSPEIVWLGDAGKIDTAVARYRAHMAQTSELGVLPSHADDMAYDSVNAALYALIWKPLAQAVRDARLLFVAPDGDLNTIAFAGLIDTSGSFLVERFAIHYLSAGRDILRYQAEESTNQGLLAMGDPDFDATSEVRSMSRQARNTTKRKADDLIPGGIRSGSRELSSPLLSPLPGTRNEIEAVVAAWQSSSPEPASAYLGSAASEENFKSLAPGKRVIHLATHGFWLSDADLHRGGDPREESEGVGPNPLMRSGLYLAGANHREPDSTGASLEDGVLTAYEVSAMNLHGTQLVVLSACESGLGTVLPGEGVYGLRRAFQLAGARTVASTLWAVGDQAMVQMFGQLYRRSDRPVFERLRAMQLAKLAELRSRRQSVHPVTWAPFVMVGDWK